MNGQENKESPAKTDRTARNEASVGGISKEDNLSLMSILLRGKIAAAIKPRRKGERFEDRATGKK
jgi:hypothetical protein